MDSIKKLQTFVSPEVKLMALAEEAAEMSQAALKMVRAMSNENPTPKTPEEAADALIEEISDVCLCLRVLDIKGKADIMEKKANRWCERRGL